MRVVFVRTSSSPSSRVLECALEGSADLVVTGDRHLLALKRFERVAILRLVDFLRTFPERAVVATIPRRPKRR